MIVYRLVRKAFSNELSGKGAARWGGRWNSQGTELIYTAENRSLAMAEVAVHLTLATLPDDYMMMSISIPETLSIEEINIKELPKNWQAFPHQADTFRFGDKFVQTGSACLLKVPSAVTKGDSNILINPMHPEFRKIEIIEVNAFPFDQRIINK